MKLSAQKYVALVCCFLLIFALVLPFSQAQAAVSSWQRGANIVPKNTTDFSSDSFKQSLKNLAADGATNVALIVPFYQSNIYSIDVQPNYNTPTDDSLKNAIQYAHSLGLKVMVVPHVESWDGNWRANINPSDRDTWFTNYGNNIVHTAQVSGQAGAEMFSVGTELVSMTADNLNSSNTSHWQALITKIRSVYSGKLVYGANATDNSDSPFTNEKKFIKFWSSLDYVGLSAYYGLGYDTSVNAMKQKWDTWSGDVINFANSVGKPVIFTEIGYRSVQNGQANPWDYNLGGGQDQTVQANAYEALFEYWNNINQLGGIYFWNWDSDPNAGYGSTDYTPQHKQAEQTIKQWFSTPSQPTGSSGGSTSTPPANQGTPQYGTTGQVTSGGTQIGQSTAISVQVKNTSSFSNTSIVDIEIYNAANNRVFQTYNDNQSFNSNETKTYTVNYTPQQNDKYTVKVGIFAPGWSQLYLWNDAVTQFTPGSTAPSNGGNTGSTTSTSTTPTSTPPTTPPMSSEPLDIWWPSDGASIGGVQPFKAMLEGYAISQYDMFWQVDGGSLNFMSDNLTDYPHKEADVDVSGWKWKGNGPYTLNFVVKDKSGTVVKQKASSVNVY